MKDITNFFLKKNSISCHEHSLVLLTVKQKNDAKLLGNSSYYQIITKIK